MNPRTGERHRPVPTEGPERCALQAQLRGDPMPGSAPPAARLLLVEQPGPWGPRGLVDSHADPDLARLVDERAAAGGMRLQAIRHPGRHVLEEGRHRVALADVRRGRAATHWWSVPDLDTLVEQLAAASPGDDDWFPAEAVADHGPLLLVCTHGRHDACCALRGRPLAAELHRLAPDRVWETTHVGGDRFAANVLVLPTGELYGRVQPGEAPGIWDLITRGRIATGHLRGWIGTTPIAQAALVHAHQELGIDEGGLLTVLGVRRIDDERADVTLRTPAGSVLVGMEMGWSEAHRLTCRGPAQARARTYRPLFLRSLDDGS